MKTTFTSIIEPTLIARIESEGKDFILDKKKVWAVPRELYYKIMEYEKWPTFLCYNGKVIVYD